MSSFKTRQIMMGTPTEALKILRTTNIFKNLKNYIRSHSTDFISDDTLVEEIREKQPDLFNFIFEVNLITGLGLKAEIRLS